MSTEPAGGNAEAGMKLLLRTTGVLALVAGLVFMGQGSGYFPWPAESFMINARQWIYYGGAIAVFGLVLVVMARR